MKQMDNLISTELRKARKALTTEQKMVIGGMVFLFLVSWSPYLLPAPVVRVVGSVSIGATGLLTLYATYRTLEDTRFSSLKPMVVVMAVVLAIVTAAFLLFGLWVLA